MSPKIKELHRRVENKPDNWRIGQAYFNYASKLFPQELEQIRGQPGVDPFYDNNNIESFLQTLKILTNV